MPGFARPSGCPAGRLSRFARLSFDEFSGQNLLLLFTSLCLRVLCGSKSVSGMISLLRISRLSVRRGPVHLLRDVDWTVRRGEHWVILGANGSGKTSLLRALTGYLTPTEGEVELFGETYGTSDWRDLRKHVGVVSASIANLVHDEDTAAEIVVGGRHAMIGVWGRVRRTDRTRALRLLRHLRISRLADRRWEVLSQGERQRVLIARALMAGPALLILDEPCAGLDPVAREHFLADMGRLAAKPHGPSLVLVTHHVEEITPGFTHLLALRRGRVLSAGPLRAGLTSAAVSRIFGASLKIRSSDGRYRLSPSGVIKSG